MNDSIMDNKYLFMPGLNVFTCEGGVRERLDKEWEWKL